MGPTRQRPEPPPATGRSAPRLAEMSTASAAASGNRPARRGYDVVVVGAGPSGSTAGHLLARAGLSVLVAERERFPRFHVGESLLPSNMELLEELGIRDRLDTVPHSDKTGVEFALGHEEGSVRLPFAAGLVPGLERTVNVVRADFDRLLAERAAAAGAEIVHGAPVGAIGALADGRVEAEVGGRPVTTRWLVDASGQATFLGKRLGLRQVIPDLRKVAYTGHFEKVHHLPGEEAGHPAIVMMQDAWFWIIRLDRRRTSVGMVIDRDAMAAARGGAKRDPRARDPLAWGIARCPFVRRRLAAARPLPAGAVLADFSYRCPPFAGPGYFLTGDAATFVDPIFSTGICLGMMSAAEAARQIVAVERRGRRPVTARRRYRRYLARTTEPFFRLVRAYYRQPFREMLLNVEGPLAIHRAALSLLAGAAFPRVPLAVRWRMGLFYACLALQPRFGLVPHRRQRALADIAPGELPWTVEPGDEPLTAGGTG